MKKYLLILTFLLLFPSALADAEFELSPLLPVTVKQEKSTQDKINEQAKEITENATEVKENIQSELKETNKKLKKTKKNKKDKKAKKEKKKKKSKKDKPEEVTEQQEEVVQAEEQKQEEVIQPQREDTEHTVEYSEDQDFNFKHEMLKIYEKRYEENNLDTENILKIAKIHLDLGQRAIAKSYYMQLYNTYPNSPRIQFEMGKFYYQCKQYNAALEFFKLSLASGYLRNIEVNEYTQKTYAKLGDEENEALYGQIIEHLKAGE
ncbi:hypothetical protein IKQ26_08840 [bacterium]|nr:hypothetical protein [bacterium]